MKYKLIKERGEEELSKTITKYLSTGEWKLYGDVQVVKDNAGFPRYFFQAILSLVQK